MDEWWKVLSTLVSGGAIGSVLVYLTALRQYKIDRRMKTVTAFLRVTALAHGYPPEARGDHIGVGEQVAAIHLVADMGRRDRWLRVAAYALLDDLLDTMGSSSEAAAVKIQKAAEQALATLPDR